MSRVSIITAAYNAEQWLRETAESVFRQSFKEWEWLIVDDGSTDNTASVIGDISAASERIRTARTHNIGQGFARNLALKQARGEYIVYLDADDLLPETYLADGVAALEAAPDARLWYAPSERFGINGRYIPHWIRWKSFPALLNNNCIYISAMHKRADAERIRGFRKTRGYEDWDYWLRLLNGSENVVFDTRKKGLVYRERENSCVKQDIGRDRENRLEIRKANAELYERYEVRPDREILVVLPYLARAAQGHELEWALAGWRNHYRGKARIVVVGDFSPSIEKYGAEHLPCPEIQWEKGKYRGYLPHIDIVNKFREVRRHYPHHKGFVYTCDDIYAVNDFSLEDILSPKINRREITASETDVNSWQKDEAKTLEWLRTHGLPTRAWVCHLPVYYEWTKWENVVDELGADTESFVIEEVYFNTYYARRPALLLNYETDPYRCRIERDNFDTGKLLESLKSKIWVSNSTEGYTERLEAIMNKHYGI